MGWTGWMGGFILVLLSFLFPLRWFATLFLFCGTIVGYWWGKYMTPDWDIAGLSKDEGRLINDLFVLGWIIVGLSTVYGIAFRRMHRSFWTHFPFVSTAIRYVYVFLPWFVWIWMSAWDLAWLIFLFIGMYVGTSISDFHHWRADYVSGELRRKKQARKRKKGGFQNLSR